MRSGKGSSGGGKGGKSKSKASKEVITTERKLEVQGDHALILRSAIRTEGGEDKNVLEDFQKLTQFNKNGLNIKIEFHAAPLPRNLFQFAFNLSKTNLKKFYDASGYGWQNEEKKEELRDPSGRFFVFRNMRASAEPVSPSADATTGVGDLSLEDEKQEAGDLVGFAHIRFSLQGEVVDAVEGEPSLFVDEIQLLPAFQRRGIGKYSMTLLELIARKHKMTSMTVPLVKGNSIALDFFLKALRGYSLDAKYGEDDVQMILSKFFAPAAALPASAVAANSTTASSSSLKEDKTVPVSLPATVEPLPVDASSASSTTNTKSKGNVRAVNS